ncbi:serine hydrolase [Mycobacterium sp. 3519A]|uniref:serine hydrolase domain-containing protein n=1 Tax=Mycobacterium sp. 3519A TaxID=2057184 RepID=UPI000C7A0857|nr:serine hydrolase domain-containing protein [Mycobacterium sp. 3519A]
MKSRMLVLLLILPLVVLHLGCSVQETPPTHGHTSPELDRKLSEIASRGDLPGFGVSVVTGDGVLFEKGYGYADIEKKIPYTKKSLQNIGSISKTLIGISLMQLVEENKIRLDDDVSRYLPFKVVNPYFPNEPILIRHLAEHTSTLQDTEEFWRYDYFLQESVPTGRGNLANVDLLNPGNKRIPLDQFVRNFVSTDGIWYKESNFLNQRPGTQFEYSNLGAALAAYVVECVTWENYADYTDRRILKPVGMTDSAWFLSEIDKSRYATHYMGEKVIPWYAFSSYPDGGLISSVEDMGRFLTEMIRGYKGESKLLRRKSFHDMMSGTEGYGIYWDHRKGAIGHFGGDPGVKTSMWFDPSTEVGFVLFTNCNWRGPNGALYEREGAASQKAFADIQKILTESLTPSHP